LEKFLNIPEKADLPRKSGLNPDGNIGSPSFSVVDKIVIL
jgi:hypothetical protein